MIMLHFENTKRNADLSSSSGVENPSKMTPALDGQWK
jgi:hypothetical protein